VLRLAGKVAAITGAASGIGRATALRFADEGARVVLNDRDQAGLAALLAEIEARGGQARACPGDVTARGVLDRLVDTALHVFDRLDVFHGNAGGALPTPMEQTDDARFRSDLALNLDAVWSGMKAALRAMVPQRSGAILTTSSGAALGAVHGLGPYGAAKAGVLALTRSVALEYGPLGIRANAICPGPIATPQMLAYLETLPGGPSSYAGHIPLRRLGTPEEIASAAVFLASDEASYVSGAVLAVDGAVSAVLAGG
jgi:meso-butanediol dehydrogenase / (S,S)-butanediol dehydrogenase / diacetyl reductase